MDNVIFEDPSKQRLRLKRPLHVLPAKIIPSQHDPTYGEQQKSVPSQGFGACDLDLVGSEVHSEDSTNDDDGDKGGQICVPPNPSDSDHAGILKASVLKLFSMSEYDRHSIEEGSHSQRDSLFSSPEPEGSAIDSDSSVSSAAAKRGGAAISNHSLNYNRRGQEANRDKAIVLDEDILDGNPENWMALRNEMLESNVGAPGLRIRPSKFGREENDDVEPPTESDNGDRGEVVHHATTTRDYCQRTEIPRMIDGTHQYALNGTRGDAREIASPAFPLSRKRRGVARPESPSQGSSACDDQASCLKKVSDSRPCHNRRVTQERRPQKPLSVSQRSKVRTRSLSHNLPLGPDKWQHNVEEVVWEYGHLLHYRIVNGNPQVLVPWVPTWEPAGEYPPEDVDRVRRESQAQKQARRRGRPRSKHYTQL